MLSAERAILAEFHPVGMRLLVLCRVVVAAFALRAGQCDLCTHDVPPNKNGHKKKGFSLAQII